MTGCIENYKNTWIHPPRGFLFKILELNPFPHIQAPFEIGNKWSGNLDIGDYWGDKRWLEWEGNIKNEYLYEITGKEKIKTSIGDLDCFIVDATATSRLGKTYLRAYFHFGEGFIKLNYTNIDGSQLIFERI